MKREYKCSENLDEEMKIKVKKELSLGFLNLSENFFEEAKFNFLVAKKLDENSPDAFWGMMLAKAKASSEDLLYFEPVTYKNVTSFEEYQKAMGLASEDLREFYLGLLERINQINAGENF